MTCFCQIGFLKKQQQKKTLGTFDLKQILTSKTRKSACLHCHVKVRERISRKIGAERWEVTCAICKDDYFFDCLRMILVLCFVLGFQSPSPHIRSLGLCMAQCYPVFHYFGTSAMFPPWPSEDFKWITVSNEPQIWGVLVYYFYLCKILWTQIRRLRTDSHLQWLSSNIWCFHAYHKNIALAPTGSILLSSDNVELRGGVAVSTLEWSLAHCCCFFGSCQTVSLWCHLVLGIFWSELRSFIQTVRYKQEQKTK